MRAITVLLIIALFVAPGWTRAEFEDWPEPKGEPKQIAEADLPAYPATAPPRPVGDEFETQEFFWFNEIDGRQQWDDPALVPVDGEGKETFTDPKTGEITDTKPAEAAWLSLWSETRETEYFYNEITQESTWEVPQLYAWHKVYVDEAGAVVAPPEDEEAEELEGGEGEWAGEEEAAYAGGWAPAEYDYSHEGHDHGGHEGHDHGADHEPLEEELAEEEVLRQEPVAAGIEDSLSGSAEAASGGEAGSAEH